MLHLLLFQYIDSPRRICDALPLSSRREGGRPPADFGVSYLENTTLYCF
jgi:hypothetical protein